MLHFWRQMQYQVSVMSLAKERHYADRTQNIKDKKNDKNVLQRAKK